MTHVQHKDDAWNIEYKANYSQRYHRKRSTFLRRWDTFMMGITLAAGAAAVGEVFSGAPSIVFKIGAALITIISIIQITTRISESAFQHREWMKRWINLELKVNQKSKPTAEDIKEWQLEVSQIESECVSELRALTIICEDESARYYDIKGRQHNIWFFQKVFANLFTFQSDIRLKREEEDAP